MYPNWKVPSRIGRLWLSAYKRKRGKKSRVEIQKPSREQCTLVHDRLGVDTPTMQSYIHFVVYNLIKKGTMVELKGG